MKYPRKIFYLTSQVLVKYVLVQNLINLRELADFIGDVYKQNMNPGSNSKCHNFQLCQKYADRSELIVKTIRIACGILPFALATLCFVQFLCTANIIPPLCIYFPGIDNGSIIGQCIMVAFNLMWFTYGLLITMAIDSLVSIVFLNMGLISSIIVNHLTELKDVLLKAQCSKREIKQRIITIVLMHKKYNE